MTFDLTKILESKRSMSNRLAALPIGDKLRLLDVLRERAIAIRQACPSPQANPKPPSTNG